MSYENTPSTGQQTTTAGDAAVAAPADLAPGDPDAIRAEIERTRSDLSRDVNALGEAVSPGGIAKRQTGKAAAKVRDALTQANERLPRSARDPRTGVAVGLVAVTAGWLLARFLRSPGRGRRRRR